MFRTRTVFPLTPFPNRVEVTTDRISIVYRTFFFSAQTFPIQIEDLINVRVHANPFFGSVRFELTYGTNPPIVSFLPREAALKLKRIITGLIEAKRKGINLDQFPPDVLRERLLEVGSPNTISQPINPL